MRIPRPRAVRKPRHRPLQPPAPAILLPRRWRLTRALVRADKRLLHLLRISGHGPRRERAAKLLGLAGELGGVWAALGIAAAAADRDRSGRWVLAAAAAPASIYANYTVKVAVGRQRPLIDGYPPLARAPTKLSFPSGHATSSLAGAVALGRVAPGARPALLALAAAICFCRPYLGMHYPTDVIAGIALGATIGRLWPLPKEREGRPATKPPAPNPPQHVDLSSHSDEEPPSRGGRPATALPEPEANRGHQ